MERVLTLLTLHSLVGCIVAPFTLMLTRECFYGGEWSCYWFLSGGVVTSYYCEIGHDK